MVPGTKNGNNARVVDRVLKFPAANVFYMKITFYCEEREMTLMKSERAEQHLSGFMRAAHSGISTKPKVGKRIDLLEGRFAEKGKGCNKNIHFKIIDMFLQNYLIEQTVNSVKFYTGRCSVFGTCTNF